MNSRSESTLAPSGCLFRIHCKVPTVVLVQTDMVEAGRSRCYGRESVGLAQDRFNSRRRPGASAAKHPSSSLNAHAEQCHRAFETGICCAKSVSRLERAAARPASLRRVVLAGEFVGGPERRRRRFAESALVSLLLENRPRCTGRPRPISRPSRATSSTTPPESLER